MRVRLEHFTFPLLTDRERDRLDSVTEGGLKEI
jgi:hypothetical protein